MLKLTQILCLILTLGIAEPALCGHSSLAAAQKNSLYLSWHNQCLELDIDTIDKHIAKFEAVIGKDPDDYLAQAYLGSAYAIRAKVSFWPPTKLSNLKHGQKLINNAVDSAPDNTRVRMVRAIAYYRVPKFFGCRPISLSDFDHIIPKALKGTLGLTTLERQALLYYASLAYADDNQESLAQQCSSKCQSLDPNSEYGKLITP